MLSWAGLRQVVTFPPPGPEGKKHSTARPYPGIKMPYKHVACCANAKLETALAAAMHRAQQQQQRSPTHHGHSHCHGPASLSTLLLVIIECSSKLTGCARACLGASCVNGHACGSARAALAFS